MKGAGRGLVVDMTEVPEADHAPDGTVALHVPCTRLLLAEERAGRKARGPGLTAAGALLKEGNGVNANVGSAPGVVRGRGSAVIVVVGSDVPGRDSVREPAALRIDRVECMGEQRSKQAPPPLKV